MTNNVKNTSLEINPIIKYKKTLLENPNFTKIELETDQVLFDEWDFDDNLYLIIKWSVNIEKYINKEKTSLRQLSILSAWDFLWEGALKRKEKKEVKVTSLEKTILYKINTTKWIESFIEKEPKIALELFVHIIDISNKRLLEANSIITNNYEMSKKISKITHFNYKNIFSLIDSFKETIWVEYILYLEKNPILKNYLTIKYDTRKKWRMQEDVIELNNGKIEIEYIKNIPANVFGDNYVQPLVNWNSIIWYLLLWKEDKSFSEIEKKIITSISYSLASIISLKEIYNDEANKKYMRWE